MPNWRLTLTICLFTGVLVNVGLHGIGWISRMVVPGLMLGGVFFVLIYLLLAFRRP